MCQQAPVSTSSGRCKKRLIQSFPAHPFSVLSGWAIPFLARSNASSFSNSLFSTVWNLPSLPGFCTSPRRCLHIVIWGTMKQFHFAPGRLPCFVLSPLHQSDNIHRIHRNHHSPEGNDGVSRHRLVPISPTCYILHFQMTTGFRLQSNRNMLLKCVNGAAVGTLCS